MSWRKEFRVIRGAPDVCESILNEWSQEYELTIYEMTVDHSGSGWLYILLTRYKLDKPHEWPEPEV